MAEVCAGNVSNIVNVTVLDTVTFLKGYSKDLLRYSLALNEGGLLKIHACSSRQGSPHQ